VATRDVMPRRERMRMLAVELGDRREGMSVPLEMRGKRVNRSYYRGFDS
jgi:hypothetical protein